MNVVFMGTPEFATASLSALAESEHSVLAVVTGQDRPVGRGKKLEKTAVRKIAESYDLPLLMPKSLKFASFRKELAELKPDILVVCAFRLLPPSLLNLSDLGAINIHASLLPKYRGAAPIHWAIINGEKRTGLTTFLLNETIDTGKIIDQQEIKIHEEDTCDSLSNRLSGMSGEFLLRTLEMLQSGSLSPKSQDDSLATQAPKITPFDAMIDFGFPAENVRNFIRGMATRPGAWTTFRGKRIKIHAAKVSEKGSDSNRRPGSVIESGKNLLVQCNKTAIELLRVMPQGKREMDGTAFVNGYKPKEGEVLGSSQD